MTKEEIKAQICDICNKMWQLGWVAANDGNVSVRIGDNEIIATPTGISKSFITPDKLVTIDMDGNILEAENGYRPSSEIKMHLCCYREREDVKSVLHAHPPTATGFAVAHVHMDQYVMIEDVIAIGSVPVTPYGTPSTEEVPNAIRPYLQEHDVMLLENHGALAVGSDLITAYYRMESLELWAKIQLTAHLLGGAKEISNSFAAQQSYYNDYIRNHDSWQLAEIYADEGITGTSAVKRDDFQRMLSDCRKGRIDKILVKSISRFARNTKECLEYIRELKALGISVFFEEHNIDTKMVTSEMLTAVLASCAQAESESISKNMTWSIQNRMQKGTFNTCRAGIGFLLSKDGLTIRPEAVPVIQSIYIDYVSGMNSREISVRLTTEKALGRAWNRKLVDYILTNERYAGNALLQKKYRTDTFPRVKKPNRGERPMYYVEGSNPAMIEQELFDQAAELRKSRRRDAAPVQARTFAKKLYCQCCGSLLRSKKTNGTWYWVCRTHEESATKCPLPPIPEEEIIRAFLRLYYNLKNHQEILAFLLQQERKIRTRQMLWGADIVEINKRISDIISQSHKLTAMQKSGNVDPDIFIAKSNQLAEQLRKAKQQKERLQTQEDNDLIESTSQMLEVISAGPDMLEAFNAELFCELIERITIQNNTRIRFRLKNGLELPESIERTVR